MVFLLWWRAFPGGRFVHSQESTGDVKSSHCHRSPQFAANSCVQSSEGWGENKDERGEERETNKKSSHAAFTDTGCQVFMICQSSCDRCSPGTACWLRGSRQCHVQLEEVLRK